jgi:hypothetical protein
MEEVTGWSYEDPALSPDERRLIVATFDVTALTADAIYELVNIIDCLVESLEPRAERVYRLEAPTLDDPIVNAVIDRWDSEG